jgi:hypothetical protein
VVLEVADLTVKGLSAYIFSRLCGSLEGFELINGEATCTGCRNTILSALIDMRNSDQLMYLPGIRVVTGGARVCDKFMGRFDRSFYLAYNLNAIKQSDYRRYLWEKLLKAWRKRERNYIKSLRR